MPTAEKLDLYKLYKSEYVTPKTPKMVETKPALYLSVTGRGEPGSEGFTGAFGALYSVAFTIKMARKAVGQDYAVSHLEGLYWMDDKGKDFATVPPSQWNWDIIIRVPDFITEEDLRQAKAALEKRRGDQQAEVVKLKPLDEGLCVQMLHVGPYQEEGKTVAAMEEFARGQKLALHGLHHEIYLSDPRRVPPERLRTILRHPVRPDR